MGARHHEVGRERAGFDAADGIPPWFAAFYIHTGDEVVDDEAAGFRPEEQRHLFRRLAPGGVFQAMAGNARLNQPHQ